MRAAPARPSGGNGSPAAFIYARLAAGAATLPSPDITKIVASSTRPVSAILSCADDEREILPRSMTAEEVVMIGSPEVGLRPRGEAFRPAPGRSTARAARD